MSPRLTAAINVEFPLFAFFHCRDVVVAVSKAEGFGGFGATSCSSAELEDELSWIDTHIDDKTCGVGSRKPIGPDTARHDPW